MENGEKLGKKKLFEKENEGIFEKEKEEEMHFPLESLGENSQTLLPSILLPTTQLTEFQTKISFQNTQNGYET